MTDEPKSPSKNAPQGSRTPPSEWTGEEGNWWIELRDNETPIQVKLQDGELWTGTVAEIDLSSVKLDTEEGRFLIRKKDILWIAELKNADS